MILRSNLFRAVALVALALLVAYAMPSQAQAQAPAQGAQLLAGMAQQLTG